ncbi:MAG: DMT family transporter [Thermoplasmata archaeon]
MSTGVSSSRRWVGPGVLLVLATAVVSGVSTFINSYAVQGTSSDAFVTWRNGLVALLLVPFAIVAGRSLRDRLRPVDWGRLALIGLVGGAVPFVLFFRGLEIATAAGSATTASFVYRTLFVMATALGVVVLRERLHGRMAVAAGLLLLGNFLLLSLTSPILSDGTAYVLAATALWAVEYTLSKRTLRDLPAGTVATGRMGFGAVFLIAYLAATAQLGTVAGFSSGEWTWIVISALLLTAFVATWYAGLRRVDLGVATSVLVLGYPITWVLAVLVRGSAFTVEQAAGVAVIAFGTVLVIGASAWRDAGTYLAGLVLGHPGPDA